MMFSFVDEMTSGHAGDLVIAPPADDMCIVLEDLPPSWGEKKAVVVGGSPGQLDRAVRHFFMRGDNGGMVNASFEIVVYEDKCMAEKVFDGTIDKMGFLHPSRLDMGEAAALLEALGHPLRRSMALIFRERNVLGLIMLSASHTQEDLSPWLIDMGRLMASRVARHKVF